MLSLKRYRDTVLDIYCPYTDNISQVNGKFFEEIIKRLKKLYKPYFPHKNNKNNNNALFRSTGNHSIYSLKTSTYTCKFTHSTVSIAVLNFKA
jgi:hypothetical protein